MIDIKGQYNNAIIYQSEIDDATREQVQTIVNQPFVEGETIRIMPDCHAGAGCVIGTTMTLTNGRVCPNLVGVDIGCGMYLVSLKGIKEEDIDFKALDEFVETHIPTGRNIHEGRKVKFADIQNLKCYRELKDTSKFERAIGTLGGGNHFLELDRDTEGTIYFVVHTGSRNIGKQVADYYQDLADGICNKGLDAYFVERANLIETYKAEGRKTEIQAALKALTQKYKESSNKVPKDLAWLEGDHLNDYLHDMDICQRYAQLNRETICREICKFFGIDFDTAGKLETIHNYIDLEQKMLRKGSIDCSKGKGVIIPVNMRDGSIIAVGKGNKDYNCSGPHGAGRLLSRNQAKENISLEDFEKSMEGIYTSCVSYDTLDESPMAYKSIESVLPWIKETADVVDIIKPIWNYKAKE